MGPANRFASFADDRFPGAGIVGHNSAGCQVPRMDGLVERIAAPRGELAALRAQAPGGLRNLDHSHDIELTWSSNAIEGNTLTAAETALVVEHGLTIAGKPLRDHMEVIDHFAALRYVRDLARRGAVLTELDVRNLHRLVMLRSAPEMAGRYADQGRFVLTAAGRHAFPSPAEVPALMGDLAGWLAHVPDAPETAFAAHLRLVALHPFNDGNGRTARLLMNLVLLRGLYPPVVVRPEDRPRYIDALQAFQAGAGSMAFDRLLYERLAVGLQESVRALRAAVAGKQPERPTPGIA